METQLTTTPQKRESVLTALANRYGVDRERILTTLKDTAFKGATDSQMVALCIVAERYNLDPFTREIFAFPQKGGSGVVPVLSIDGWISTANKNPEFDGVEFSFSGEINHENPKESTLSCSCSIYRKDRSRPTTVVEWFAEVYRNTEPWNTTGRRMLRHRAFIQAARLAFGFSFADPEDQATLEAPEKASQEQPRRPLQKVTEPTTGKNLENQEKSVEEAKVIADESADQFSLEAETDFPSDSPPVIQLKWLCDKHEVTPEEVRQALISSKLIHGGTKHLRAEHIKTAVSHWEPLHAVITSARSGNE